MLKTTTANEFVSEQDPPKVWIFTSAFIGDELYIKQQNRNHYDVTCTVRSLIVCSYDRKTLERYQIVPSMHTNNA